MTQENKLLFTLLPCDLHSAHLGPSVVIWALIPYVTYLNDPNAIMCKEGVNFFFVTLLLQKLNDVRVKITWHYDEVYLIKSGNIKTTTIVKTSIKRGLVITRRLTVLESAYFPTYYN